MTDSDKIAQLMAEGASALPVAPVPFIRTFLTKDEKLFALTCIMRNKIKMDAANPPSVGEYLTMCSPDTVLFVVTEVEEAPENPADRIITIESAAKPGSPRMLPLSEMTTPNADGLYFIRVMNAAFGVTL
jgi:hypothetical protein